MLLGKTFEEQYENFFKFFDNKNYTIKDIEDFIQLNKIPTHSTFNRINLNMIDSQNLNILFYITKRSTSDEDCVQKLKLLIEKYKVSYTGFDFNYQRKLPFYTCVRGYLKSTKYLIEKMNFKINDYDSRGQTLFFCAFRSYNLDLIKYLDEKFPTFIFFPDYTYSSCIYNIFKKNLNQTE